MSSRNLAGVMWPSGDVVPPGSKPDDFDVYAGIRFRRSEDPNMTPRTDIPENADREKLAIRLSTHAQAPTLSSGMIFDLQGMLNQAPCSISPRPGMVEVGDRGPDFQIFDLENRPFTLQSFRGRPVVLMFMRVLSTAMFCPHSLPGMVRMQELQSEFYKRGVQLAVLLPTDVGRSREFVQALDVSYTVYADPNWSAFNHYTRRLGSLPLQGWTILDGDGIVRWIWRLDGGPHGNTLIPMPAAVLAQVERLFGVGAAA
ncbi:MAG: redoxin domain-containing protein [Steroidobacteraceae bacterium]